MVISCNTSWLIKFIGYISSCVDSAAIRRRAQTQSAVLIKTRLIPHEGKIACGSRLQRVSLSQRFEIPLRVLTPPSGSEIRVGHIFPAMLQICRLVAGYQLHRA